ncbi:KdsC family phosphatase [Clostridium thermarum]|uniref:KdsC family phosphatase n=1 Tax=Clostridium thermarum TaxID=1716543 RepID=UPI0013D1042B|nr:3-deoxy-D-manno-octulosonate 8-phosphate phosphatase [Clostridium thermarum]
MRKNIKLLVLDVDGTLTDGKIYISNDGEIMKAFNVKDGFAIHELLPAAGIIPAIITGRSSQILTRRCEELGIAHFYQGVSNKIEKLDELLYILSKQNNTHYGYDVVSYMGDDINDLSCMVAIKKAGGLIGCPSDAVKSVKSISDFISSSTGGNGAVREFIEWLIDEVNNQLI